MKNQKKTNGEAQVVKANTAATNNIIYVVTQAIFHFDGNGKPQIVKRQETTFNDGRAIDNRINGFQSAFKLTEDAKTDGKLYKEHLDTVVEGQRKRMKNVNTLWVMIDCVNEKTGERVTISEADFFHQPDVFLDGCVAELSWYREYGCDTDGRVISIMDHERKTREILDYGMVDTFGIPSSWVQIDMEALSKTHTIVKVDDEHGCFMPNSYGKADVERFLAEERERILAKKN
jgi:hypothetical protein